MIIQDPATVAAVAVALGTDAFSVALGLGIARVAASFRVRFVGIVGILHVLMPLIGLEVGLATGRLLGIWAGRIGALVLVWVAYDMVRKGIKNKSDSPLTQIEKSGKWEGIPSTSLVAVFALGLSVSMDALTVGFGLGTAEVPIGISVAVIGVTAGVMTAAGFWGGRRLGKTVGRAAQALGGCVLLLIALKMVL